MYIFYHWSIFSKKDTFQTQVDLGRSGIIWAKKACRKGNMLQVDSSSSTDFNHHLCEINNSINIVLPDVTWQDMKFSKGKEDVFEHERGLWDYLWKLRMGAE